ncbi:hypothetical protein [Gibbsiella quercinecans]|uniref:hypothetical protein n=1 Tax=Gibbsiella quercinecans TaxID=929813 RepID=UPI003A4DAFD7
MKLNFRIEQEFGHDAPTKPVELGEFLYKITKQLDVLLGTKKTWYEQGYSRKQALQHIIFGDQGVSESTLSHWEVEYKKEYPNWNAGTWHGGPDDDSAGIDLYSSYSSTGRRNNPLKLTISFNFELNNKLCNVESMVDFITFLICINDYCTNVNVASGGYSFSEIIPKENGYDEVYKKVFPDRISCGWMLFVPAIIFPNFIPEAGRVVPIIKNDKQIGTIVVSTEDVFDGNNKEHIAKSNDIEIRLLDLGMLPLMTEL